VAIVRSLPDYFTDDVPEKVARDLGRHHGWVLADSTQVAGFLIVDRRSRRGAEILWAAVRPDLRSSGKGGTLVDHVLEVLGVEGVRLIEVKTLDAAAGYPPYEMTRGFWEKQGFVQIDAIDPLPGWPPGNPAALYVCALSSTR